MSHTERSPAVAFHDELADRWEQKYSRRTFGRRAQTLLRLPGGEARPGEHWLDAGCGTGTIARCLAQQGCRVTAVDGSARMIAAAERATTTEAGFPPVRFLEVEDVVRLPFADAAFDAVVCSSVLEYVESPPQVLSELARVLRPAGRLIVSVPNRPALLRRAQKIAYWLTMRCGLEPRPRYIGLSMHAYTPQTFARVLAASGFEARAWRYYGPGVSGALSNSRYAGTLLMVVCVKARVAASEPMSL